MLQQAPGREVMREFIERQPREREHDAWFRQQVQEALAEHRGTGRPGRVRGTRELVVGGTPYVVAYRLGEEAVMVLRMLHGARTWPRRI